MKFQGPAPQSLRPIGRSALTLVLPDEGPAFRGKIASRIRSQHYALIRNRSRAGRLTDVSQTTEIEKSWIRKALAPGRIRRMIDYGIIDLFTSYTRQPICDRRRYPVRLDAEISQDDLGRVISRKSGDVAARMAARTAKVESWQMPAVSAGPDKGAMVADLSVGKSAD